MSWYRFGAALLLIGLTGLFVFWEYHFFPKRVSRSITKPIELHTRSVSHKSLLAEPAPIIPDALKGERAIAFKLSFEDPEGMQLTPPLLDNLVTPSRLESLSPLKKLPNQELFPVPASIRKAVDFWKSCYSKYTSYEVVLHDRRYLGVVYDVLDFTSLKQQGFSDQEIWRFKKDRVRERMNEIDNALKQLNKTQGVARRLTPLEGKIWKLWEFLPDDPKRFAKAREELRSQTGMRDRFRRAIQRAGAYLPYMEDIFLSYQLPPELTRLVFVESMFVNEALSKTGAAGLWQFMPGTAKLFMKLNEWVDERLDPFIATESAARLLSDNYSLLGSWPLAINAYNSGPGRLKQAVRRLGTDDIGVIINRFKGRGYGFASRNFYPSFIAALEVSENYRQLFGDLPIYEPITYETVKLPAQARIDDIASILELDVQSLRDLNPAFLRPIYESDVYLPAGANIRVPLGDGADLIAGVYNLAARSHYDLTRTEMTEDKNSEKL